MPELHQNQTGMPPTQAVTLWREVCDLKNENAMLRTIVSMALIYIEAKGGSKDFIEKVREVCRRSAEQN